MSTLQKTAFWILAKMAKRRKPLITLPFSKIKRKKNARREPEGSSAMRWLYLSD
jgi:hypothetical protein